MNLNERVRADYIFFFAGGLLEKSFEHWIVEGVPFELLDDLGRFKVIYLSVEEKQKAFQRKLIGT